MRKIFLLAFALFFMNGYAQNDPIKFWDNVKFGGGLGFSFGTHQTTLAISPSVIYVFNDQFQLGIGGSYIYAKNYDLKSNVFGLSILGFYNPLEQFQLSAELEQVFANQRLGDLSSQLDYPALHLGAAYRIGFFSAGFRYDVLYQADKNVYASPFSPVIRFYF